MSFTITTEGFYAGTGTGPSSTRNLLTGKIAELRSVKPMERLPKPLARVVAAAVPEKMKQVDVAVLEPRGGLETLPVSKFRLFELAESGRVAICRSPVTEDSDSLTFLAFFAPG